MTVEQVKQELASLSFDEQGQLTAYLVQLRNATIPSMFRRSRGGAEIQIEVIG